MVSTQESSDVNPPPHEQDPAALDKTGEKEPSVEEEVKEAEGKQALQREEETPAQQDIHVQEEEHNGLQDPEAPVVEQRHEVPVHQEA